VTSRISYPSSEFPAPVSLSLELPDGWIGNPTSGTVLAAFKPGAPDEFTPNVVVTSSRFGGDYRVESAIAVVEQSVKEIPDAIVLGSETRDIAGFPGFRIEFSFTDSRAGTLIQAVRVVVVPNGDVSDLVTVTGSATATQAQTLWPELRGVQESLTATV
jgi:hypothetical protein